MKELAAATENSRGLTTTGAEGGTSLGGESEVLRKTPRRRVQSLSQDGATGTEGTLSIPEGQLEADHQTAESNKTKPIEATSRGRLPKNQRREWTKKELR